MTGEMKDGNKETREETWTANNRAITAMPRHSWNASKQEATSLLGCWRISGRVRSKICRENKIMSLYEVFFTEDEYMPITLLFIYLDMITEMPRRGCWNQMIKLQEKQSLRIYIKYLESMKEFKMKDLSNWQKQASYVHQHIKM